METGKKRRTRGEGSVHQLPNGKFCGIVDLGKDWKKKRIRRYSSTDRPRKTFSSSFAWSSVTATRAFHTIRAMGGHLLSSVSSGLKTLSFSTSPLGHGPISTRPSDTTSSRSFGPKRLSKFDVDDVGQLFNDLRKGADKRGPRAPRTLKKVYNFLNAAFRHALRTEKATHNPMGQFDSPKYEPKEFVPLNRDEVERFLQECVGNEKRGALRNRALHRYEARRDHGPHLAQY